MGLGFCMVIRKGGGQVVTPSRPDQGAAGASGSWCPLRRTLQALSWDISPQPSPSFPSSHFPPLTPPLHPTSHYAPLSPLTPHPTCPPPRQSQSQPFQRGLPTAHQNQSAAGSSNKFREQVERGSQEITEVGLGSVLAWTIEWESQLLNLLAVWPWASCLTWHESVPVELKATAHAVEIKWNHLHKGRSTEHGENKGSMKASICIIRAITTPGVSCNFP